MGDFRHIRNDLVHGNGNASKEETGKCKVLKWFKAGEQIIFDISHVLDFIHHLGFLGFSFVYTGSEASSWDFPPTETLLSRQPVPKIISVRTDIEPHPDSGEIWCLISLVYSNGFFSNHAFSAGVSNNNENRSQIRKLLDNVKITPEGNLDGPVSWLRVRAQDIYPVAVDARDKFRKGESNQEFPKGGFPGPWVKFRSG